MILLAWELIIILALLINLLTLVVVKNKTSMIIGIIISNLLIILSYNLLILDQKTLKELIIANIIYSIIILVLAFNTKNNNPTKIDDSNNKKNKLSQSLAILIFLFAIAISSMCFYLTKNLNQLSSSLNVKIAEKESLKQNSTSIANNSPNYLATNVADKTNQKESKIEQLKDLYNENERKKLKNNILFNRSTDAIIIIVGIITALLFNYRYQNN